MILRILGIPGIFCDFIDDKKNLFKFASCISVHFKIKMYPTILGVGGQAKKESKEDDLQILQEIPGKSGLPGNMSSLQSLLGAAASGGGSGGAGAFFNPPSILQAQDPFFNLAAMQAGGSSSANTLDLLQKCKFLSLKHSSHHSVLKITQKVSFFQHC